MTYRHRIIDDTLDEIFSDLAAIALDGAKGVGKTATGSARAATVLDMSNSQLRGIVETDSTYLDHVPRPILLDEWQLLPEVWDRVKRGVDADLTGGRYLLAGSAGVAPGVRTHSGAGRIVSLKMRPLSLAERGIAQPSVSLRELLGGDPPKIKGRTDMTVSGYIGEILAPGVPGIRVLPEEVRPFQLDSHIDRIVQHEMPENGAIVRRPTALHRWLAAYAAATSTTAAYATILDAATAGDTVKAARNTLDAYREQLTRLFILDPREARIAVFNPLKRLGSAPSITLSTRLWRPTSSVSIRRACCAGTVRRRQADAWVGHLRTKDGQRAREIDLIVEGRDRSVVAIQVKLAGTVSDSDVRHLNWLHDQLGDRFGRPPPPQHRDGRLPPSGRRRRRSAGAAGAIMPCRIR